MGEHLNQPKAYDAILGGQHPAPMGSMILGGLEGVKWRLASPVVEHRIAALSEALKYGVDGLDLAIECLHDRSCKVRHAAYLLLENRTETRVQHALRLYNSHTNRFNTSLDWDRTGNLSHIDTMMENLENPHSVETHEQVDQSLSLVQTSEGQNRIKHYLFNGTATQKNYAARYFRQKGRKDVLSEAQRQGYIDRKQVFSR